MKFPNTFNTRTERIEMWYEQIKDFLTNEKLLDLMKQFDFSPDTNLPVLQLLSEVKDFTEKKLVFSTEWWRADICYRYRSESFELYGIDY